MTRRLQGVMSEQLDYYRYGAEEYHAANYSLMALPGQDGESRRRGHEQAVRLLVESARRRDVLEIAGGTGIYTRALATSAAALTVVDASPESIAINRNDSVGGTLDIDFQVADIFTWQPPRRFEVIAFAFWLSHVPRGMFMKFWTVVDRALARGGTVILVDAQESSVPPVRGNFFSEDRLAGDISVRALADGRSYRIVRVLWNRAELIRRLAVEGWESTTYDDAFPWLLATIRRTEDGRRCLL